MEENPQLTKQLSLTISTERNTKHFEAEITTELHASQESMEYIISCVCVCVEQKYFYHLLQFTA
jgi:hypothetical protein